MSGVHRFLPAGGDDGSELSQILATRREIVEGKGKKLSGRRVSTDQGGFKGGIRDREASVKVQAHIKAAPGVPTKEGHLKSAVKPLSKGEMLQQISQLSSSLIGKYKSSISFIKEPPSGPKTTKTGAATSPPLGEGDVPEARAERAHLSKKQKQGMIKDLELGKRRVLRKELGRLDKKRQGFQLVFTSLNTRIFDGGCGSLKEPELLEKQKRNMRLAVFKAIDRGAVDREDADDLRQLLDDFDEMAEIFSVVGPKRADQDDFLEEDYAERLADISERADVLSRQLPKEPMELHIACVMLKLSANKIRNTL